MITARASAVVAFIVFALAQGQALAQAYPAKRITVVVGFPAGVSNDVIARAFAPRMAEGLGQPVVVDNRAGAAGNVAADAVAKSPADGYTLIIAGGSFTLNMHITQVNFGVANFAGISMLGQLPTAVSVSTGLGTKSIAELVALAKAKPGLLSGAATGNTSVSYFMLESLKKAAGIDVITVDYKGSTDALGDLMANRVGMMFSSVSVALPPHKSGKLPMLGISGTKRSPLAPEVPTFIEAGYPMLDISQWAAMLAPAGTPRPVIARLNVEIVKAARFQDVQTQAGQFGFELTPTTPEAMDVYLKSDYAKWGEMVRSAPKAAP